MTTANKRGILAGMGGGPGWIDRPPARKRGRHFVKIGETTDFRFSIGTGDHGTHVMESAFERNRAASIRMGDHLQILRLAAHPRGEHLHFCGNGPHIPRRLLGGDSPEAETTGIGPKPSGIAADFAFSGEPSS